MKKISVAILGATGNVGQRFIQLLDNHPWFEVRELCASEKNMGKFYQDAVNWKLDTPIPEKMKQIKLSVCKPLLQSQVIFSALDAFVAETIEEDFAKAGYIVITNAKSHRMKPDVPLLIPEVNPQHLNLISQQQKRLKSKGFIITNPNCTTVGLTMMLKPLHDAFEVKQVLVSSLQALSGAGYPGISSLDITDNVIPYIAGEEEKIETEPLKLLAMLKDDRLIQPKIAISAHCNRVAVRDGHIENVTLGFKKKPLEKDVITVLENFSSIPQNKKLPFAPAHPVLYTNKTDRPQPYFDRNTEKGMAVIVGRVRKSNILDIKLSLLVHNTIRGAAGAAILNAELLKSEGFL